MGLACGGGVVFCVAHLSARGETELGACPEVNGGTRVDHGKSCQVRWPQVNEAAN